VCLLLVGIVACQTGDPLSTSITPIPTVVATPIPTVSITPSLVAASPSVTPTATLTATPSLAPEDIRIGDVVATVVDALRARSEPRISDDSFKFEPLIPLGTTFLVTDGPVSASGYRWYRVAALAAGQPQLGWVAAASRSGEPWLGAGAVSCPAAPTDIAALAALPSGTGLACFAREPITVEARLIPCNCDIDGSWYSPDWFYLGGGSPDLLVEPSVTKPPGDTGDWFPLHLDPAGDAPDPLPVGDRVEVTGIFDHPAAATCTLTPMDGQPAPSNDCRLEFAVTELVRIGP
jgi:hypothetical protein